MADLFGPKLRSTRRVMMHAIDTWQAPGMMHGLRTAKAASFLCGQCGYDSGWWFDLQDSEVRRGLPCPRCNEATHD